jgi:glutamine amidotransferase
VIAIVDYGIGNLGSVLKAFRRYEAEVELTADPAALRRAAALVLPGDGAFGAAMDELRARGLDRLVLEAVSQGTPLLGVCVGMQLLFEESEEHGRHRGLALLPGRVRRFEVEPLPVPHMGWNQLDRARPDPLLDGLTDGAYVYFVHSYWCDAREEDVVAWSDYGGRFPAIVARGNVLGLQFHPEKSQDVGLRMIGNFVRAVREAAGRPAEARP